MKPINITLIVLLFMSTLSLQAQTKTTKEVKGKNNTYIAEVVPGFNAIYNKNNIFSKSIPSYLEYQRIPPISIEPKSTLDSLVNKYLTPFFKKYKGNFNSITYLRISLFSDGLGTIKDVMLNYPVEIGIIPTEVIEEFEAAVLCSDIRLEFDINHRVFKGTTWVSQYRAYGSDKLRDSN